MFKYCTEPYLVSTGHRLCLATDGSTDTLHWISDGETSAIPFINYWKFLLLFNKFCIISVRRHSNSSQENQSGKEKIYDLVMQLINSYLGKGHKLYVDNYYTSPILFHDLYQRQNCDCGTMRINRKGVPADLKTVKLKKGESLAMTNGTLQLLKWKDKRDVHMCTTVHTAEFIDV